MRVFLDGEALEFNSDFEAQILGDRVIVKTPEGAFSGLAVRYGDKIHVSFRGQTWVFSERPPARSATGALGNGEIRAPMPGVIVDIAVQVGDAVLAGQRLVVLEAMKTQQPLKSPFAGLVTSITASMNQQVAEGDVLAIVTPEAL